MSEQSEVVKLKRITIKTDSGSRWFDAPHKSTACQLLTQAQRWSSMKNSRLETLNAVHNQNFQAGPLKLQMLLGLPSVMPIKTAKRQRSHTDGHIAEKMYLKKLKTDKTLFLDLCFELKISVRKNSPEYND